MKNHIERIKKQALEEAKKVSLVILGAVSGMVIIKGLRSLTAEHPTLDTVAKYALPLVTAGGGFLISSGAEEKSKAKYFGYGLTVAGTIEGVKLIPVAGDYLSGLLGSTEIPAASMYLTENMDRDKLMAGFGLINLNVDKASMSDAEESEVSLPDLGETIETEDVEDLGYNPDTTSSADPIKGIL